MIYRYFKQSTFSDYKWNCKLSSSYLSVWYLSFIIFHLEEKYGQNFAIQMGIPTGSDNFDAKKRKAVSLLLTAYHLVEEVFQNDLERFLSTPIQELEKLTTFIPYSDDKKSEYSILVFPEAYAGLKSLTNQKKIESGMSLMVDIGGGTTDITFFTIENESPKIYDYSSIPYGINYIAETALPNLHDKFDVNTDLNSIDSNQLNTAIKQYYLNLVDACDSLVKKLRRSFERTGFPINRLNDALKNRIIIYSGGGSTYKYLRRELLTFSDVKHVSNKIWEGMTIDEINEYVALCPILSTSLGLAISEINETQPDFIWVGLGAPKQEIWMAEHQGKVKGFMVGVGAAFDYMVGNISRAPEWMQNHNLEWLYRLLQDPKRLFYRYLYTNPKFIWHAIVKGR
jgi:hypothetical protein